jgi:hypothetical protein
MSDKNVNGVHGTPYMPLAQSAKCRGPGAEPLVLCLESRLQAAWTRVNAVLRTGYDNVSAL